MAQTFKVNDRVQLNSGGPCMTIERIEGGEATCVWFAGQKVQRETFAVGNLTEYAPPGIVPPLIG